MSRLKETDPAVLDAASIALFTPEPISMSWLMPSGTVLLLAAEGDEPTISAFADNLATELDSAEFISAALVPVELTKTTGEVAELG
ncbi:hypothetical protein [Shewanella sp.]|uniref:hypothetical protein n=1 Tax=Shewanella sp. TaxID=50422 RepID=UPI003565178E